MKLERIINLVYCRPWAILPEKHAALRTLLDAHLKGASLLDLAEEDKPAKGFEIVGKVAILPIEGVILGKASGLEMMCGAFSLEKFRADLKQAAASEAESIILNIASGGGTISGVPETASLIREVSKTKPVYAYSNDIIASAAYWLAVGAKGIFLSQSAEAGSVGVYCALLDSSKAYEKEGYKMEVIKGGENNEYKALGYPGTSLTDKQRAHLKEGVDKAYFDFAAWILSNRPNAKAETFDGRMFDVQDAITNGLADGRIDDLNDLISYLNK